MNYFAEKYSIIKTELSKLNIPQSDFDGMAKAVCNLNKEYSQLKEENHSVFLILLLTAAYNAGRKSVKELSK